MAKSPPHPIKAPRRTVSQLRIEPETGETESQTLSPRARHARIAPSGAFF